MEDGRGSSGCDLLGIVPAILGDLFSQKEMVKKESEQELQPEEIMKTEWLAENVIGKAVP